MNLIDRAVSNNFSNNKNKILQNMHKTKASQSLANVNKIDFQKP
jgi:hypothetical protein